MAAGPAACPAGHREKENTELRGSLPFNYLKRSKSLPTSHPPLRRKLPRTHLHGARDVLEAFPKVLILKHWSLISSTTRKWGSSLLNSGNLPLLLSRSHNVR